MSVEYDLKKSEHGIGQLYPILEAKDGEVIDGFHREEANKNWKRIKLEHIDTEEKKLVARLVANFHRRQITREEKEEWINGLAEIYKNRMGNVPISVRIADATGLTADTIREYLDMAYKERKQVKPKKQPPRVSASQAIVSEIGKGYGKRLVERHREEVLAEERSKIERAIREKTKRELLMDRGFKGKF